MATDQPQLRVSRIYECTQSARGWREASTFLRWVKSSPPCQENPSFRGADLFPGDIRHTLPSCIAMENAIYASASSPSPEKARGFTVQDYRVLNTVRFTAG